MAERPNNVTATDCIRLTSNRLRVSDGETRSASQQLVRQEDPMRIVLVHDDAMVLVDFRELLSRLQVIEVVGQYASCDQVLSLIIRLRPDLVLLDITVPGRSGLDALQSIRRRISRCSGSCPNDAAGS